MTRTRLLAAVSLATGLVAAPAPAQPSGPAPAGPADVVIGRREVLHSALLNEDRPLLIALPAPSPPDAPTPRVAAGGSLTVSAWIRPQGRVAYGAWVSKATRPYGSQWRVGFAAKPDEQWGLTLFAGRWSDYWVAQAPIPDGKWTHVVVTGDQTIGQLRYYKDGRPAGGTQTLAPFLASDAPLYVGFQQDDGVCYAGDVDDLRLWDRVLSPAEVTALLGSE